MAFFFLEKSDGLYVKCIFKKVKGLPWLQSSRNKQKIYHQQRQNPVLRICANVCATLQLPPNFPKNAKQDTLLLHCNLSMVDHLKRMMGFDFQGARRLAWFKWGIPCAKPISGKRSERANHLAGSPLHASPRLPAFLCLLITTHGPLSAWPTRRSSSRTATAQAIPHWGPCD